MAFDQKAAERAIHDFLRALGRDPDQPELAGTPARMAEAFGRDLLSGYDVDVPELIERGSEPLRGGGGDVIALSGIAVTTVCPHHLMPAQGRALVAYLPGERLLGIGTVAKLVDAYARRLTLQEKIGESVVAALLEHGRARGAYCELRLSHSCLSARGARQSEAELLTTARAGELRDPRHTEALRLALERARS